MTLLTYNTMLKFYRALFWGEKDSEQKAKTAAKRYMEQQHKFYRGPNND